MNLHCTDNIQSIFTAENSSEKKEEEERRRMEVLQTFRTAPFEEIVARSEAKVGHLPAHNSHVFLIP